MEALGGKLLEELFRGRVQPGVLWRQWPLEQLPFPPFGLPVPTCFVLAQLFVSPTSESGLQSELAEIHNFIFLPVGCVRGRGIGLRCSSSGPRAGTRARGMGCVGGQEQRQGLVNWSWHHCHLMGNIIPRNSCHPSYSKSSFCQSLSPPHSLTFCCLKLLSSPLGIPARMLPCVCAPSTSYHSRNLGMSSGSSSPPRSWAFSSCSLFPCACHWVLPLLFKNFLTSACALFLPGHSQHLSYCHLLSCLFFLLSLPQ